MNMSTKQRNGHRNGAHRKALERVRWRAFLDRGYNVVANSRNITKSGGVLLSPPSLHWWIGNIGESPVAARVVEKETAISKFGSIDALVNNAGIFFTNHFTRLHGRGLQGAFQHEPRRFPPCDAGSREKQMLSQKSGGSVVSITTSLVVNPIAGVTASVPMITKGGLEAVTRSLARRVRKGAHPLQSAVAPGHGGILPFTRTIPKSF